METSTNFLASTESICCREMVEINDEQFQGIYPLATNMASVFSFVTVFSYIYNIFSTVNSFIFTFLKLYL